jgi:hypothetical protein
MRGTIFLDYVPRYEIKNGLGYIHLEGEQSMAMPLHVLRTGTEICRQILLDHDADPRTGQVIPFGGRAKA